MTCLNCAASLPASARFCPSCGTRVPAERHQAAGRAVRNPVRIEVRKTVTVIFCDLVGSTALSQQLDPEPLRALMLQYFALMRDCVERHGGLVEKYIGDAVMAVFGVPAVHEDDALRAVRAASEMQAALDGLNRDAARDFGVGLSIRIGVNTGPVVAAAEPGGAESMISGETVNLAARLEQHAGAGEVLLGPLTCQAVHGAAEYEFTAPLVLKGITRPVTPGRLVAVAAASRSGRRRFDRAFVDRRAEFAGLREAFRHAVAEPTCQLVTLHGDPGIGKSRLISEFAAWASEAGAVIAEGCCAGYGSGGSALALAEAVGQLITESRAAAWTRAAAAPELAEALTILRGGLLTDGSPGFAPDETAWALRLVLAEIAREHPLVLILDDMHWAAPTLLAVIADLAGRLVGVPALLLCVGRPEFVAENESWTDGLLNSESALVGPLPDDDCYRLVADLNEVVGHDAGLAERAIRRAEGNPLYLEQFITVSAAGDVPDPSSPDGAPDTGSPIPASINGLIAYRLDLLPSAEREVLGLAAVCGRQFTLAEVVAAADPTATPWQGAYAGEIGEVGDTGEVGQELAGILAVLAGRRLIRQSVPPEIGYRFDSVLIHEVAYGSLPKRWRAGTHERLADWLASTASGTGTGTGTGSGAIATAVGTGLEAVGAHWERAWQLRREIGTPAAARRYLARRGAAALEPAGTRALANGDPRHAVGLLGRALVLCRADVEPGGPEDPRIPMLLLRAGEARLMSGEIDVGRRLITDARDSARAAGAQVAAAHAELRLAYLNPVGQFTEALAAARRTLPVFEAAGDQLGIARALMWIGVVEQSRGRHARAIEAMERALAHTRDLDAELEHATVLGALAVSLWLGPQRALAAIAAIRSLLQADAVGRRLVRAALLCPLAMLVASTGEHDEAATLLGEADTIIVGLGNARANAVLPIFAASASSLTGDLATAESMLVRAHAMCLEIHDTKLAQSAWRDLSRVRLLLGADVGALELADDPDPDDVPAAVADSCGVRARVAARLGQAEQARQLCDLAQRAARRTDSPVCKATALLDAATAMRDLGDRAAARDLAVRSARSFSRKGHRVGAGWARALIAEVPR